MSEKRDNSGILGSAPRVRGTVKRRALANDNKRFSPARAGNGQGDVAPKRTETVQPRACGERAPSEPPVPHRTGSAPRVRGTDKFNDPDSGMDRFSPARAGNGPII